MSNKSYKTKYQELESKMNQFYANKVSVFIIFFFNA